MDGRRGCTGKATEVQKTGIGRVGVIFKGSGRIFIAREGRGKVALGESRAIALIGR